MFNPKQALERIRRSKNEKEDINSMTQDVQPLFEVKNQSMGPSLENRVNKMEAMISKLSEELSNSTEVISKLKRQNSNLQTQILKLEYENSELKSNQVISSLRRNGSSKKMAEPIRQEPDQDFDQPPKRQEHSRIQRNQKAADKYSHQVEKVVQEIRQEPLQSILKRKQNQFRAMKNQSKTKVQTGNKHLKQLATIEKDYKKTMKKPVLIIKLDDADFE